MNSTHRHWEKWFMPVVYCVIFPNTDEYKNSSSVTDFYQYFKDAVN